MEDNIKHKDGWSDSCIQNIMDRMASGHYPYLEVFMSRENNDHRLPQDFLYVDSSSFGKVTVLDLWFRDDKICIEVQEFATGLVKEIIVYVNSKPDFLMVKWDDIVSMVQNESTSSTTDDTVLDFEF